MKKYLIIIASITLLLSSCVNTKKIGNYWVYKNQNLYRNYDTLVTQSHIKVFNIDKGLSAKIEDKDGELTISDFDKYRLREIKDTMIQDADGSKKYYHYPSILTQKDTLSFRKSFLKDNPSFRYLEISPIFQASTIPFKYRPKRDSLNGNVSTSGNLGFVYGLKFSNHKFRNIYNSDGKRFNTFKTSISITPGFFVGPTTVDLTAKNTENKIKEDITVLGINSGFLLVFGVNKFNIGGAIGFDHALGNSGSNWIYNGRPWYGFVLSLDFIE
jgi:hypothetical protein